MIRHPLPPVILEQRVIAVVRGLSVKTAAALAGALTEGGLRVIEVTVEGAHGIDAIASLDGAGMTVGAGTVTSVDVAERAVTAGAMFVVAPHFDPAIVKWALERGVPVVPGAFTPTEVFQAWQAGASAVKWFPASVGGADALRAIRAPFPDIPIIPTGGVDGRNALDYLEAGAIAVGVGGWLTGQPEPGEITRRAVQLAGLARVV